MPYIKLTYNSYGLNELDFNKELSKFTAELLNKNEKYVMVDIRFQPNLLFAASSEPAVYIELKSIGLPENNTDVLSEKICTFINEKLSVAVDRIYIEFSNVERHLWGWNKKTFAG